MKAIRTRHGQRRRSEHSSANKRVGVRILSPEEIELFEKQIQIASEKGINAELKEAMESAHRILSKTIG